MSKYNMEDGTVVDTDDATGSWDDWFGFWETRPKTESGLEKHQRLHCSRKGRYYLESWNGGWFGWTDAEAKWLTPKEACAWLLKNHYKASSKSFPLNLMRYIDDIKE